MKQMLKPKLILDIILTIVLLTLFSKNFFGIHYHEVVGLAVLIPILVHILINLKTVRGMCKNFKRIPFNVKICLIMDILLLLTFAWMGISGILISKTILTGISTTNAFVKIYHMCIGGLSLLLLGIHIGLHICRKKMRTKVAIALTILAFAGGIYGISSSEIVRWIGMPFMTAGNGENPPVGLENGVSAHNVYNDAESKKEPHIDKESLQGQGKGSGNGAGKGLGKGSGNGPGKGLGNSEGHGQRELSLIQKIDIFIQFFGLMFSFAMATYWLVILCSFPTNASKFKSIPDSKTH